MLTSDLSYEMRIGGFDFQIGNNLSDSEIKPSPITRPLQSGCKTNVMLKLADRKTERGDEGYS